MKLIEFAELTSKEEYTPPNGVELGEVYTYEPKLVRDSDGNEHHILTVYSYKNEHVGKKSYAMLDNEVLQVKILKNEPHVSAEDGVIRVRVISKVDQQVARFSLVNQNFTTKPDGEKIIFKLKNLPDFENYDNYTDKEFREEFGRARLSDDHGLVGYLYVEEEVKAHKPSTPTTAPTHSSSVIEPKHKEEDHKASKMDAAVAIYKASKPQGRKRVIDLFQRQLGMTAAGASSYYTKAMHAVEKDN